LQVPGGMRRVNIDNLTNNSSQDFTDVRVLRTASLRSSKKKRRTEK
jgi:hypothetical protein